MTGPEDIVREALEFRCDEHATLHPTEPALAALSELVARIEAVEAALVEIEVIARKAVREGYLHQHEWVQVLNRAAPARQRPAPRPGLRERDEAIHQRGVATEWAAELAGKKRAAEAALAETRREGDKLLAVYRDALADMRRALEETLPRIERGLIAGRDFANSLPLDDGASRQAIDREFVAITLVPDGLVACETLRRALAAAGPAPQREVERPSWRTLELVRDIVERGVGPDTTPQEALTTIGHLIEKRHPRAAAGPAPEETMP